MAIKILLVEPNNILAKTIAAYMEHHGYLVTIAHDAQAALHCADQIKPDLVILELQLPANSGIEFLYEFRSYDDWQSIPVIIHSLLPNTRLPLTPDMVRRLGISQHLYKPITSLQSLERIVARSLTIPRL